MVAQVINRGSRAASDNQLCSNLTGPDPAACIHQAQIINHGSRLFPTGRNTTSIHQFSRTQQVARQVGGGVLQNSSHWREEAGVSHARDFIKSRLHFIILHRLRGHQFRQNVVDRFVDFCEAAVFLNAASLEVYINPETLADRARALDVRKIMRDLLYLYCRRRQRTAPTIRIPSLSQQLSSEASTVQVEPLRQLEHEHHHVPSSYPVQVDLTLRPPPVRSSPSLSSCPEHLNLTLRPPS